MTDNLQHCDKIRVTVVRFADYQNEIEHIRRTVFIDEQGIPEALEWDAHEHDSWHCLATYNDNAAGTGRLQVDGKITRIAVLPQWRGKGVANSILQQLLSTANDHQLHALYLNAQTTAIALYEKFGFHSEGDVFDEGGIAHIRMVRT